DMNSLFPFFNNTKVNASSVEVYFCPSDACADQLIKKINLANKSLFIAIYSFTNDAIADAVIKAKQRGVDVKVIFDYDQSKIKESDDELLSQNGVLVAMKNGAGYMHNKYSVIDGNIVATGSFNYSENANTRNEENLVFIDSSDLAKKFTTNFNDIWASSDEVN
ncbi:MAG: phospholipase D-like domain-containing protein, partial [archaeon]